MGGAQAGELDEADARRFFGLSQSLFAVIDTAGFLLRMSPQWERVLGRPIGALVGRHFLDFLHPDDVASTTARMQVARCTTDHDLPPLENRYVRPDGSVVWLRWDTQPETDGNAVWCVATEVTAVRQRAAQQELVADLGRQALEGGSEAELLDAAVTGLVRALQLPIAVVLQLRPEGHLLARASTGVPWDPEDPPPIPVDDSTMAGRALRSRQLVCSTDVGAQVHRPDYAKAYDAHGAISVPVGRTDRPWGVLTCADRRVRSFDEAEQRFVEQVAHVLGAAIERRAVEDQLQHQATHDGLTGLPNRELLRQHVTATLADARREGTAVGLLLCDLDGFKDVNDSLGHAAGDAVLQQLAGRLGGAVGDGGMVARLGGDEFAICVAGPATELEVLGVADAIVHLMREPFSLPGLQVPLSTSIGVAVSPTHGRDAATLLKHADVAMYRAKSSRLGWALYDATLDEGSAERLTLTADLREALSAGRLHLLYQPVVDLQTGQLVSLEALCRWTHPTRGAVPPAVFVPLAEQTGLIGALTRWVVSEARDQVHAWRRAGIGVPCAINLSMAAVTSLTKSASLLEQLIEAAPDITVEITESWLADDRGKAVVSALASAGVSLALDDFGTGWSSLAVLASFPVDRLKLDRQFLVGLDGDARGSDLLRAVADLAAALEMDVVAEGVERADTSQLLLGAGINLGQGVLWAPALPAHEVVAWAGLG